MIQRSTNYSHSNKNLAMHLLLVCILLFGAFHVSYQHDELLGNGSNHEQGCEYCSSVGSATVLPANEFYFDLLALSHFNNVFFEFLRQHSNLYQLHNPRAPPSLV